jgi:hypothetical protein
LLLNKQAALTARSTTGLTCSFGVILINYSQFAAFESNEALELIYSCCKNCGRAKKINKDLPQAISDIIMMLLSKMRKIVINLRLG